jgi:hypothetical protein
MAHKREGGTLTKLEYIKFEITRGLWIKHKLHGHICRVKRKSGERWDVYDTKSGDTHNTAAHTIYRYYDQIT